MGIEIIRRCTMKTTISILVLCAAGYIHAECPSFTASICGPESQNCDMGVDMNGCWMGDYCQPLEIPCPVICPTMTASICGPESQNCDMGLDMNGCWLGDYCQPTDMPCYDYSTYA